MEQPVRTQLITLLSIVGISLSGCATHKTSYRNFDTDQGGALIDVKQRAIIVKKLNGEDVVCAEPSPDAISALSTQLTGEASKENAAAVKAALSSNEAAAFVGLRTQSIQLLRDAMFRACEAYANGAMNGTEYSLLTRRYQRAMVALLAIEQLTGVVRAPSASLDTSGSATLSDGLQRSMDKLDAQDKLINQHIAIKGELESELATNEMTAKNLQQTIQTKSDKEPPDNTQFEQEALESTKAKIKTLKIDIKNEEDKIKTIRSSKATITGLLEKQSNMLATQGLANASVQSNQLKPANSEVVAKAVVSIASQILAIDDTAHYCYSILTDPRIRQNLETAEPSDSKQPQLAQQAQQDFYTTYKSQFKTVTTACTTYLGKATNTAPTTTEKAQALVHAINAIKQSNQSKK